ncbi:MAG: response regulator [Candidatus Omnitrophica bacterium]|nr:response regulator [Candidatus Omnitrophota bacterium]
MSESEKKRILFVDDEPDLIHLVSMRLQAAGYEVDTASDGQAALDYVKKGKPDLIILDLMLPKLDGYKVCRLLKFDERYRGIPVLIFTARAEVQDIHLAMECGADGYLTKPFEVAALLGKLKELLALSGGEVKG